MNNHDNSTGWVNVRRDWDVDRDLYFYVLVSASVIGLAHYWLSQVTAKDIECHSFSWKQ